MIRTTVRFDDDLFKNARKEAIDKRMAFADIVNEALSHYLDEQDSPNSKKTGTEFLGKLIQIGRKYHIKGPKSLAENHDKYLWDEYRHN